MVPDELRTLLVAVLATAASVLVANALLLVVMRVARALGLRRFARSERQGAPALAAFEQGECDEAQVLAVLRGLPRRHATVLLRRAARVLSGASLERLRVVYGALGQPRRDRVRLQSRRFWVRLDALHGFSYFAFDGPPEELGRLLRDPRESVRVAAARALARMGTEPALRLCCSAIGGLSRLGLIELIHTVSSHGALAPRLLAELLETTESPKVRQQGADLALQVPAPELFPVLLRFAADADTELAIRATRALSAFHDEKSLLALRKLLGHEAWQVRGQAAKGLGLLGDRESSLELLGAMSDRSWWVRYNSALALRRLGPVGEGRLRRARVGSDKYAGEMAERVLRMEMERLP